MKEQKWVETTAVSVNLSNVNSQIVQDQLYSGTFKGGTASILFFWKKNQ